MNQLFDKRYKKDQVNSEQPGNGFPYAARYTVKRVMLLTKLHPLFDHHQREHGGRNGISKYHIYPFQFITLNLLNIS